MAENPRRRTILTIDDDDAVRAFIVAVLTGCGYEVWEASDGAAGIAILERVKVDAILLDVNMPGMSGREVAQRLKQDPRTRAIPVVMLTGSTLSDDAVAGLDAGADEYLGKPIPLAELIARVRAMVRRRELEEELVRLEQERMEAHLAFAREIQQQLLPKPGTCPEGLEVAVRYHPCDTLGGDFYDWLETAGGRPYLILGDAEGHGVGAALWMATARAYVRASLAEGAAGPGRLLAEVNRLVCADRRHSALVPMMCVRFDLADSLITWASAGHESQVLAQTSGACTLLESTGPMLGMIEDSVFEEGAAPFAAGDALVCFTDGLNEAFDAGQNQLGRERVEAEVRAHRALSADALADRLILVWREHVGDRVRDDLTVIAVKR